MGERSLVRAAASSMARGRPSSRRQIAAIAAAAFSVRSNEGSTARARAVNRRTASLRTSSSNGTPSSGLASGGTGYSCSALDAQRGTARGQDEQAGSRGEQLGDFGARRRGAARSCRGRAADVGRGGGRRALLRPLAGRVLLVIARASSSGSRTGARSTKTAPSRKACSKLGSHGEREARLAASSSPRERHEASSLLAQERRDRGELEARRPMSEVGGPGSRDCSAPCWARPARGPGGASLARAPGAARQARGPAHRRTSAATHGKPRAPLSGGRLRYSATMCCSRNRSR